MPLRKALTGENSAMGEDITKYTAQVLLEVPAQMFTDMENLVCERAVAGYPDVAERIFVAHKQTRQQHRINGENDVIARIARGSGYLAAGRHGQGEVNERRKTKARRLSGARLQPL